MLAHLLFPLSSPLSLDGLEDFPGPPVVDDDEDETGQGSDQGHGQGHHGDGAGWTELGNTTARCTFHQQLITQ